MEHFAYPVPSNRELNEDYPKVYRISSKLQEAIRYTFTHPFNKYNKTCNTYFSRHPNIANDMGRVAVQVVRDYVSWPQRYGHSMENIEAVILFRMWREFIHHMIRKNVELSEYMPTKLKMLKIQNNMFDLLLAEVVEEKYIQSSDDMVKVRPGKGLRESNAASLREGDPHFEYLCSLD